MKKVLRDDDDLISNGRTSIVKGSHAIYPNLSKMTRDVMAVPATGAGVDREFSISGRVITKQCNRLAPPTIRDIMQYKR